jgi:hypothetical protein
MHEHLIAIENQWDLTRTNVKIQFAAEIQVTQLRGNLGQGKKRGAFFTSDYTFCPTSHTYREF